VRLLVETKWKVPPGGRVASADLKQMFCYHELFACGRSLLLYPSTSGTTHVDAPGRYADREHMCALAFLDIDGDVAAALRSVLGAHASTRAVGSSRLANASF
jgi:5-methylcytosine-specific restriction endonuclease McrBC regulatory subunit McrC